MFQTRTFSRLAAVALLATAALAACHPDKPNNTPDNPEKKDEGIRLVIENVTIDGKPATDDQLRVIGRTDIVNYTGKTNDDDLIQLEWIGVTRGQDLPVTIHAKPNLYLKDFKYRYRPKENQEYIKEPLNVDTYKSADPLKRLSKVVSIPTVPVPEDDNNVYVTLEYLSPEKSIGQPHVIMPGALEDWKKIHDQVMRNLIYSDRYKNYSAALKYNTDGLLKAMIKARELEEYYRHRWYDIAFLKDKNARKEAYERAYRTIEANAIEIANFANSKYDVYGFPNVTTLAILCKLNNSDPNFLKESRVRTTLSEGLLFLSGNHWQTDVQGGRNFGYLPGVYNIYPKKIPDIERTYGSGGHY